MVRPEWKIFFLLQVCVVLLFRKRINAIAHDQQRQAALLKAAIIDGVSKVQTGRLLYAQHLLDARVRKEVKATGGLVMRMRRARFGATSFATLA